MEALDGEEDDNLGPDDHLHRVLGNEHGGRVRCRPGKNIVPTRYWGTSSASHTPDSEVAKARFEAAEAMRAMKEERERNKSLNDKLVKALSALCPSLPADTATVFDDFMSSVRSVYGTPTNSGGQDGDGAAADGGDGIEGGEGSDDMDDGDGNHDSDGYHDGDSGDDERDVDPLHF